MAYCDIMPPQFSWPSRVVEHSESRGYQPNMEADNVAHTILTPEESIVSDETREILYSTLPIRFWIKTEQTETCWVWLGAKYPRDYGCFYWQGKNTRVTRLVWLILFGQIPAEMMVCHKCDNPSCFNPAHLFLGTNQDNYWDSARKGRASTNPVIIGEANGQARLTADNVREIKAALSQGISMSSLSERYGVTYGAIWRIHTGDTWSHIEVKK